MKSIKSKRTTIVSSIALFIFLFPGLTLSAPLLLNYQGTLIDDLDQPVTGDKTMSFKVYDAETGGNLLWNSGDMLVEVLNGVFNVALDGFPADLFSQDDRYMGVFIGATEIGGRRKLASVPFAIKADSATIASTADALNTSQVPKARGCVHKNNAFSVSSGYHVVPLTTIEYDPQSCFQSGKFVAPVAGYYHINATVSIYMNPGRVFIQVEKNGSVALRGSDTNSGFGSTVAGDLKLNAGDNLRLMVYSGQSGTVCHDGCSTCYMSVHLISK